jgi:hypothetical protein
MNKNKNIYSILNIEKPDAQIINDYYNNPQNPGSFSGISSLFKSLKIKYPLLKLSDLKKWGQTNRVYTRHYPLRKSIKRNKTIVGGINDTFQMDLCDLRALQKENNGYNYLLTIIDVFSKRAFVFPLKNKTAAYTLQGIEEGFKYLGLPKRVHTDEGKEFFNYRLQNYFKACGIKLYKTNSENKASIIERFNRTFKEKMWRYFSYTGNFRYLEILNDLTNSYNNSYHRSIKMTPNQVDKSNASEVYLNLYGFNNINENIYKPKFNIGDHVRISKYKKIFDKGYTANWSSEIFMIDKILFKSEISYHIRDLTEKSERIEGVFYEKELQKVAPKSI